MNIQLNIDQNITINQPYLVYSLEKITKESLSNKINSFPSVTNFSTDINSSLLIRVNSFFFLCFF